MANPNAAPYIDPIPDPNQSPFPTPYAWVARQALLPNGQPDPNWAASVPRVLDAPKAFQPTPEALKPAPQPITLRQDRKPSESLIAAARAHQDDGTLTGYSWIDSEGNSYKVSDFRQESREREEFYVDRGSHWYSYNNWANKAQKGLNHAPWPISTWPPMVTPKATLKGFQLHGGPGIQAIGVAKMRHDREYTGYRTVDIYDAEGGLKEMKTFHSTAEFQAYIDSNTVHPKGYVDDVEARRLAIYGASKHGGSNFHGGFDYLDQAPVALGFQKFELGEPAPPRKPRVDYIPYHGSPKVPVSVLEAIDQGKRLGLGTESGDALVGFTWDNGWQQQTVLRSVMIRKSAKDRKFTGDSTLEQAIVVETTFVTPEHNVDPKDRDNRPGGNVQKLQVVMTLTELQQHFEDIVKEQKKQAATSHGHGGHGQSARRPPKPTNAHFALPELESGDILHNTLRRKELSLLYRRNRLQNSPQLQATIGRLVATPLIERPNRQRGTPIMTYRRALTLMSRYDKVGWEDRARGLWQAYGKDNPDARGLVQTINDIGEEAAATSAKGVLTDIHKTLDRMGLQADADERISMSDILVVMSRRHEENLLDPKGDRSDKLVNADPFAYTEPGLRARREIVEMFIANIFNQSTLNPELNKAGQIVAYARSTAITDQMPKDLADWILDIANRVGPKNNRQLSPAELVEMGEALTNFWVDPTIYDEFDRKRFTQRQQALKAQQMMMPIAA